MIEYIKLFVDFFNMPFPLGVILLIGSCLCVFGLRLHLEQRKDYENSQKRYESIIDWQNDQLTKKDKRMSELEERLDSEGRSKSRRR